MLNDTEQARQPEAPRSRNISQMLSSFSIVFVLLVLIALFSVISPGFFSTRNMYHLLQQVTVVGIITVGQCFVIISKGIDLSQGSIIGMTCIMSAIVISEWNQPVFVGILVGLVLGALVGVLNGILIAYVKIPAFIATLGMLSVIRAVALLSTGGNNIYNLPPLVQQFAHAGIGGILPYIALIMIVIVVLAHILLTKTRFGRYCYAIGSNEQSAKFSGVQVQRNLFLVYLLSAVLSAVAGVLMMCRLNSGVALSGENYQMNSIAAVVIGGGSLFGGEGNILGALVGAFIMTLLSNGLQLIGVSTYWQELFVGVVLIIAVFVDNIRRRKMS